ncbi:MAG: LCP family protein [Pelosinus sp.]|nr:LCP family protein [Pelosinus sp.]
MGIIKKRVRWGRVSLVLLLLTLVISSLTGIAVYAWNTILHTAKPAENDLVQTAPDVFKNRINILLLGLDDGEKNVPNAPQFADTMIVASINAEDASISLLSIPRETKVTIPGYKNSEQIMYAYYYGGPDLAVRTAADFLHIPIQHYIAVNSAAFINLVDAFNGVNLYVENDMDYEDSYAPLAIHLKKGYQRLTGVEANHYVRFRQDELGDIGRVQRQERFLKAFSSELFQVDTILKLPFLINSFDKYAYTDMKFLTLIKLANTLKSIKEANFYADMVPGKFAVIGDTSYWVTNKAEVKQITDHLYSQTIK